MAKRKPESIEPITGIGRDPDNKLTVQKSQPLTWLWQSDLSLTEFKILDTYLARINSHKPKHRTVILQKGELESILGITKINIEDLKQRLKHLSQPIDLAKDSNKKIHLIGLFEEAAAEQDKDGIWQIQLTCTEAATKYIFNIENLGYLRYKLRCITSLASRYSYVLFVYLEANRYRKSWDIDLSELKQILNCHNDALYTEYKRFNERILKKCQKELHDKTECRFAYTPIRHGRSVSAIHFELEMLSPEIEAEMRGIDPNQMSIFDVDLEKRESRERRADTIGFGFDDEVFDNYSDAELIEIKSLARACVDQATVDMHYARLGDRQQAQDCATAEYIIKKIKAMDVYDQRKPIKNRYSYLKKSIIKDGN